MTTNGEVSNNDWKRPDKPSKCTWKLGMSAQKSPHFPDTKVKKPKVLPNVLHHIHDTPMVRLNKIPLQDKVNCQIYAKCEYFNPGGSIKDRIAIRMVEEAERSGQLKPGDTLIEPTSGNTGIGIALVAAVKGYRCIIVMPEKMSQEKVDVLKALGAEIVRTPTSAKFDSPDSNIRVADRLLKEIPNSHVLNQYRNPANPLAHYDRTGEEILDAFDGKLDMVVCGAGTGGTISGIARKIKEKCPTCIVVGVDPVGSILASPPELNKTDKTFYEVEGIGYDFLPTVFDRSCIDRWYKSEDKPSFTMARRLIKEEGILCGGSSGSAMYCAIQAAKDFNLGPDQKVAVVLPDSIRNYMSKHLSDEWLKARSLVEDDVIQVTNDAWMSEKVSVLSPSKVFLLKPTTTVAQAVELMKHDNVDFAAIVSDGDVIGSVTGSLLVSSILKGDLEVPLSSIMSRQLRKVNIDDTLGVLCSLLQTESHVLVFDMKKDSVKKPDSLVGELKCLHLATYLSQRKAK